MLTRLQMEILVLADRPIGPLPGWDQPDVWGEATLLMSAGLIEQMPGSQPGYVRTTALGRAHVQQMLALPLPTQQWVGVDGRVIVPEPDPTSPIAAEARRWSVQSGDGIHCGGASIQPTVEDEEPNPSRFIRKRFERGS